MQLFGCQLSPSAVGLSRCPDVARSSFDARSPRPWRSRPGHRVRPSPCADLPASSLAGPCHGSIRSLIGNSRAVKSSWMSSGTTRRPGDEVGHREGVDVDERLPSAIGQRRQPIDDDHRALVQRRLHRDGPRGDERHVRRREHVVGLALDDDRRRRRERLERREQLVVKVRRARDDELHVRDDLPDQLSRRRRVAAGSRAARCAGCPAAARRPAARAPARRCAGTCPRGSGGGITSSSGWPTQSTGTPRRS